MIIDTLVGPGPGELTEYALLKALDGQAIDGAWMVGGPTLGRHGYPYEDTVKSWVKAHPDRLRWIRRVNLQRDDPLNGDSQGPDPVAVYLSPGTDAYSITDRSLDPGWDYLDLLGLPIIVQTGIPWRSEALQVATVADGHPKLPFIMTNGGQLNISGLGQHDARLALERPNVYAQTTGVYRQDFIEETLMELGHKLLYASGFPTFDMRLEYSRIAWAKLPEAIKQATLGRTALRLSEGRLRP